MRSVRPRVPLRRSFAAALLAGLIVVVPPPVASPQAVAAVPDPARSIAAEVAGSLVARQAPVGGWSDPVVELAPGRYRDSYGNAMAGAALVEVGYRSASPRTIAAGFKAIGRVLLSRPGTGPKAESDRQFINVALADSWPYAKRALERRSYSRLRRLWLGRLRGVGFNPPAAIDSAEANHFANRQFLEDLLVLRVCSLRLGAGKRGTILGNCRSKARFADDLSRRSAVLQGGGRGPALLADRPDAPLSYNALSSAVLARSLTLLPRATAKAVMVRLSRALSASVLLQGPDGDVGWAGRSNEQPWGLAGTAYAARRWAATAGRPSSAPGVAAQLDSLALRRLAGLHVSPAAGFDLTPAFRVGSFAESVKDLDSYATAVGYSGLTLLLTSWASEVGRPVGPPPPIVGSTVVKASGAVDTATARTATVWAGLSGGGAASVGNDPRRSNGLLRLKARGGQGEWVDLIAGVPSLPGLAGTAHPGPVYIGGDGNARAAIAATLSLGSEASILMRFALPAMPGAKAAAGLVARFSPEICGLRVELPGLASATARFAFNVGGPVTSGSGAVAWPTGSVAVPLGVKATIRRDRGTALAPSSAKVALQGAAGQPLSFSIRATDCS